MQVHYGMGVSLKLRSDWNMYLSSPGIADPKINLRAQLGNTPCCSSTAASSVFSPRLRRQSQKAEQKRAAVAELS